MLYGTKKNAGNEQVNEVQMSFLNHKNICDLLNKRKALTEGTISSNICPKIQKLFKSHENTHIPS